MLSDYGDVGDDGKSVINPRWAWLPTVVCDTCRKKLRDGSHVYFAGLKRGPYRDLRAPRAMTRASGGVCDCSCCLRSRVNIPNNEKELDAYDAKQRVGRPSTRCDESSPEAGPQIVQVCTECWIQVDLSDGHFLIAMRCRCFLCNSDAMSMVFGHSYHRNRYDYFCSTIGTDCFPMFFPI